MVESIMVRIREQAVERLEETVRSWSKEPANGTTALELEDAVRICRSWPEELDEVWHALWRKVIANPNQDYQKTAEQVLELFDRALSTLELVDERARSCEAIGRPIKGSDALGTTLEKIRALRTQFVDQWPWINEAIIEEALAEYARGEYQTPREILDELQGKHP